MSRSFAGMLARAICPLLVMLLVAPPMALAQVPPVPPVADTMVVDSLRLPRSEPTDTPQVETDERQVVHFPAMPLAPAAGFAAGEWVWDREALLREAPTSLSELLRTIPSVPTYRGGMFAQPEASAAFGGTAGRVEIEIDGFVLDPLAASTFDLSQFPMAQIREIRVQRRLGLLRIRIRTEEPDHTDPYTRVEAGVGQPAANLFRGLFLVPHVALGPLGLAIERLDTDGVGRTEPASIFSGWGKWAWTDGTRGVQLELLRSTLRRQPDSPWPVDRVRQDLVLRLRNGFAPGLFGEIFAGRSVLEESTPAVQPDTVEWQLDRSSTQAGARASYQMPQLTLNAAFRYRNAAYLPRTEFHVDADAGIGPVRVGAEATRADWPGHDATLYYGGHAEVGMPYGASAFAEMTGGRRGAPALPAHLVELAPSIVSERSGWRAGLALQLGSRATGSIAYVSLDQDMARPFGLPFDSAGEPVATTPAQGIEAYGRLVIVPGWLAIESWISDWQENAGWVYLPARTWRTALEMHTTPLPSGNLEILARFEAAQRGAALVFVPTRPTPEDPAIGVVPAHTVFNGYLQIRVIDVRMFVRWEDLTAQIIEDLPGRFHRGQRIFYGVKWNFWN
ncbi:hypothetical protein BH23GEM9_BH23GEM9_09590 [soil metagenome]